MEEMKKKKTRKEKEERKENRSPKGNMWSAIPVALLCMVVNQNERQGSGPEGDKVLYNTGDFRSFVRPSVRPPRPSQA